MCVFCSVFPDLWLKSLKNGGMLYVICCLILGYRTTPLILARPTQKPGRVVRVVRMRNGNFGYRATPLIFTRLLSKTGNPYRLPACPLLPRTIKLQGFGH